MTPLPVDVGRSDRRTIETVESYDAAGPFTVAITNHADDTHVHLRPDDDLARVARLEGDGNYFVEAGETRRVPVEADPSGGPVTGGLYVETGYGAETVRVEVTVEPPEGRDVDVDETLSKPPGAGTGDDPDAAADADAEADGDGDPDPDAGVSAPAVPDGTLPVAALAVAALAIAALAATVVNSPVVIAGIVVVLAAVVVAGVLLVK